MTNTMSLVKNFELFKDCGRWSHSQTTATVHQPNDNSQKVKGTDDSVAYMSQT